MQERNMVWTSLLAQRLPLDAFRFILKTEGAAKPYEFLMHHDEILTIGLGDGACLADLLDYLAEHCSKRWATRDPVEVSLYNGNGQEIAQSVDIEDHLFLNASTLRLQSRNGRNMSMSVSLVHETPPKDQFIAGSKFGDDQRFTNLRGQQSCMLSDDPMNGITIGGQTLHNGLPPHHAYGPTDMHLGAPMHDSHRLPGMRDPHALHGGGPHGGAPYVPPGGIYDTHPRHDSHQRHDPQVHDVHMRDAHVGGGRMHDFSYGVPGGPHPPPLYERTESPPGYFPYSMGQTVSSSSKGGLPLDGPPPFGRPFHPGGPGAPGGPPGGPGGPNMGPPHQHGPVPYSSGSHPYPHIYDHPPEMPPYPYIPHGFPHHAPPPGHPGGPLPPAHGPPPGSHPSGPPHGGPGPHGGPNGAPHGHSSGPPPGHPDHMRQPNNTVTGTSPMSGQNTPSNGMTGDSVPPWQYDQCGPPGVHGERAPGSRGAPPSVPPNGFSEPGYPPPGALPQLPDNLPPSYARITEGNGDGNDNRQRTPMVQASPPPGPPPPPPLISPPPKNQQHNSTFWMPPPQHNNVPNSAPPIPGELPRLGPSGPPPAMPPPAINPYAPGGEVKTPRMQLQPPRFNPPTPGQFHPIMHHGLQTPPPPPPEDEDDVTPPPPPNDPFSPDYQTWSEEKWPPMYHPQGMQSMQSSFLDQPQLSGNGIGGQLDNPHPNRSGSPFATNNSRTTPDNPLLHAQPNHDTTKKRLVIRDPKTGQPVDVEKAGHPWDPRVLTPDYTTEGMVISSHKPVPSFSDDMSLMYGNQKEPSKMNRTAKEFKPMHSGQAGSLFSSTMSDSSSYHQHPPQQGGSPSTSRRHSSSLDPGGRKIIREFTPGVMFHGHHHPGHGVYSADLYDSEMVYYPGAQAAYASNADAIGGQDGGHHHFESVPVYKFWNGLAVQNSRSNPKSHYELRLRIDGVMEQESYICDVDGTPLMFLHTQPVGHALMEIRKHCIRMWHVEDVEIQLLSEDGEVKGNVLSSLAWRLSKHLRIVEPFNSIDLYVPIACNVPDISDFAVCACRFFVNRPLVAKFEIPTIPGTSYSSSKSRMTFVSKFSIRFEKSSDWEDNWSPVEHQHANMCIPTKHEVGHRIRCLVLFDDLPTPLATCTFDSVIEMEPCELWTRKYVSTANLHELYPQALPSSSAENSSDGKESDLMLHTGSGRESAELVASNPDDSSLPKASSATSTESRKKPDRASSSRDSTAKRSDRSKKDATEYVTPETLADLSAVRSDSDGDETKNKQASPKVPSRGSNSLGSSTSFAGRIGASPLSSPIAKKNVDYGLMLNGEHCEKMRSVVAEADAYVESVIGIDAQLDRELASQNVISDPSTDISSGKDKAPSDFSSPASPACEGGEAKPREGQGDPKVRTEDQKGHSTGGQELVMPHKGHSTETFFSPMEESQSQASSTAADHAPPQFQIVGDRAFPSVCSNNPLCARLALDGIVMPKEKQKLKVMSFNVLCPEYAMSNLAKERLYASCLPEYLDTSYRLPHCLQELHRNDMDIFCLQEVSEEWYEFGIKPLLEEKYISFHKTKARIENRNFTVTEGVAIFFRRSRFRVIGLQQINLSQKLYQNEELTAKIEDIEKLNLSMPGVKKISEVLKRVNSVAQIITVEDMLMNKRITVANTHLFSPPVMKNVRMFQMLTLLREVEAQLEQHKHQSVIICGDLNADPGSGVYDLLTQKSIPSDHQDWWPFDPPKEVLKTAPARGVNLSHSLNLSDPYAPTYATGQAATFGCNDPGSSRVIDYIMCQKFDFTRVLPNATKSQLKGPTATYPSDHISISVDMEYSS